MLVKVFTPEGKMNSFERNEMFRSGRLAQLIKLLLVMVVLAVAIGSLLRRITTEPSHVTVIVDKPWFFGHGGVRPEYQKPGVSWYWVTTHGINVPTYDFRADEGFDDLPTKKQSFIDFKSYLKIRITDPVKLVSDFKFTGGDPQEWWSWYKHSIQEQYRTIVRNVAREYLMEDILTSPTAINEMESKIRTEMDKLIKEIGIPIQITDLSLGRASPNGPVMAEIDATASQQQRIKTEQARELAEKSKKDAEIARAEADNAYRTRMNLSSQEFVALEAVKRYSHACAQKDSHCVIMTGQAPVVVPIGK